MLHRQRKARNIVKINYFDAELLRPVLLPAQIELNDQK